jgi:hypothetical protein
MKTGVLSSQMLRAQVSRRAVEVLGKLPDSTEIAAVVDGE